MAKVLLKDGGTGQELLKRSAVPPHPLWSAKVLMDEPAIVQAVHEDYIRAGAKLITLNTYSVTPERLAREGAADMFAPLQTRAIEVMHRAIDAVGVDGVKVAACLPPLHGSYRPDMSRSHDDLLPAYQEILEGQVDVADYILCETLSSISELTAASQAASETAKPVITAMTLMDDGSPRLRSGEALDTALEALEKHTLAYVGLNCSKPEIIDQHLPALAKTGRPFGAYANGFTGIDALQIGGTVAGLQARTDVTPARYSEYALGWAEMGATFLGGCCEVGPDHIAHLADALHRAGHTVS